MGCLRKTESKKKENYPITSRARSKQCSLLAIHRTDVDDNLPEFEPLQAASISMFCYFQFQRFHVHNREEKEEENV